MKKLLVMVLAGTTMLTAGMPSVAQARPHGGSHHGRARAPLVVHAGQRRHSGWSTAGSILAGVMIGSILQNTCAAPPRRAVIYTETIYRPAPVQYVAPVVQYAQPAHVVQYAPPQAAVQPPVTETVWIENANGSKTPVELRRADGGRYIGPRGEYYMQHPTMDQLRQVYGL